MPNNQIKNISIPIGKFYGPCSGHDVTFAIENFASEVNNFVFCDVNYRQNTMKSFKYLPKCCLDWELISRKFKQDKSNLIKKIPNSNKSFRTFCTIDNWLRPDGTIVVVEFWCDLAEDILVSQFDTNSISVFMHINDGESEGGSNLWFLEAKECSKNKYLSNRMFLSVVADRLVERALIVTDGKLTHHRFSKQRSFNLVGICWEYIAEIKGNRVKDRVASLWRACISN